MDINSLISRVGDIEEKAIRRVRTPEGARTYGQPIGTVITRDMIERAKRKREAQKKKAGSDSNRKPASASATARTDRRKARTDKVTADNIGAPIPKDFDEPGLPGMGKFKSKEETNKKRYEKLFAKMGEDSLVYDERNKKTYRRGVIEDFKKEPEDWKRFWFEDGSDSDKEYTDSELADIVKGQPDISYEHLNDDGEYVESHRSQTFTAGGTMQPVEKRPATRKKPTAPKDNDRTGLVTRANSEIDKEISRIQQDIGKLKAKPDTGVESTKKRRERQIAKAEERIKALQASKGNNSAQVDYRDKYRDKPKNLNEGDSSKWDSLTKKLNRLVDGYEGTDDDGSRNTIKKEMDEVAKELDSLGNGAPNEPEFRELPAKLIKKGDLIRHKGEWKKVEFADTGRGQTMLSLEGVPEDLVVSSDRGYDVQYPGGKKPSGNTPKAKREPGTSRFGKKPEGDTPKASDSDNGAKPESDSDDDEPLWKRRYKQPVYDESKEESLDGYTAGPEVSASKWKAGDKAIVTVRGGVDKVLTVESTTRTRKGNTSSFSYNVTFTNGLSASGTSNVTRFPRAIPKDADSAGADAPKAPDAPAKVTESADGPKKPKTAVPAPTQFADPNGYTMEARPLNSDELSKRAQKFEDKVVADTATYKEVLKETRDKMWQLAPTLTEMEKVKGMPASKTPTSLDDLSWKTSTRSDKFEYAKWGNLTLSRHREQVNSQGQPQAIDIYFGQAHVERVDNKYDWNTRTYEGIGEAQLRFIRQKHGELLLAEPPKVVEREEAPFWDYWNGLRGVDWMEADETDSDYSTVAKLKEKNMAESKRLGVTVSEGFGVDSHAILNSVLETYRERYPGFLDYNTGAFVVAKSGFKAIASFSANGYIGGVGKTGNTQGKLTFNKGYFSDTSASLRKNAEMEAREGSTGYFSQEDAIEVAQEMGISPVHVNIMHTMNHELGHAIGSWIFGESDPFDAMSRNNKNFNPRQAQKVAEDYSKKVTSILQKHGILKDGVELRDYIKTEDTNDISSRGGQNLMERLYRSKVLNKTKLSANLSSYGATNMHEVMAETWASYSLSKNPTEFVLELGEAMEDLLLKLSDDRKLTNKVSGEKSMSLREALMTKIAVIEMA